MGARRRVLARQGHDPVQHARKLHAGGAVPRGLRGGEDSARLQQGTVGAVRALEALPREHVSHRIRRRDDEHEADELPRSFSDLNEKDGAFYGPKIDFDITDAIGRKWQCGTIQLDYMQPENFDLKYIGADNTEHRPIVIHRAILGSFERFTAILIEHYAGAFPLWLAPIQAVVLPIADRHLDFARTVQARLRENGLRVAVDDRQEKIGYKIREAQLQKVPYMLVVGDREAAEGTGSGRTRAGGDQGASPVEGFIASARAEVARKQ